ncbi:MAG: hypothetical protein GXP39_07885 [Chloroflexi bacterium]|nr:hypothetical protein [Chloroflexota bacterium]
MMWKFVSLLVVLVLVLAMGFAASAQDGQDGQKTVACCVGDVNGDARVDILDFSTLAMAYGSTCGDTRYNPAADLWPNVPDCEVNEQDFRVVQLFFNTRCE